MLLSTSWTWWGVLVAVWQTLALPLGTHRSWAWLLGLCVPEWVLRAVPGLHMWRLEVPGGPCPCQQPPTSDAWARREVPQLLWPPPGGRAAPGHSHPQLAWPQLPAALTCSLMHTWHPCLHFLTCPSPVSASWDHLPSKLLGLVTLSHDKLLEEHSLWHSPPNTLFFFSFFLKNQNPNTWGRDSKPSPRTWIVSGISQTG